MKRYVLGLVGLLACAQEPVDVLRQDPAFVRACRSPIEQEILTVDTSRATAAITIASQDDAERQLVTLAKSSLVEDAWLYLPRKNLWIDVGMKPATDYVDGIRFDGVEINSSCLAYFKTDSTVIYHIHPFDISSIDLILSQNPPEEKYYEKVRLGFAETKAFPSEGDVLTLALEAKEARLANGSLSGAVVSEKGVAYYFSRIEGLPPTILKQDTLLSEIEALRSSVVVSADETGFFDLSFEQYAKQSKQRLSYAAMLYNSPLHWTEFKPVESR